MPSLLIAGHGFLGAALKDEFNAAGWEVTTLSRSEDADICCDLTCSDQVMAIAGDYDVVIQCASSGGGGEEKYRQVYLESAKHLIARFPASSLIYVSSTSVYAQEDHSEVCEASVAAPKTATGKILKQTEDLVLAAGGRVARLSGLYGPGRCHIVKNLLAGKARLDGEGERVMNFVHRADAASALRLIAEQPGSGDVLYNVSAGSCTQRQCYQALADHFGLPLSESAATTDQPRKRGNSSKYVRCTHLEALGWQPRYPDFLSMALACLPEEHD
ncbi:NAD-dependent epimerase/dehydratase family protein [Verrucomicrobiaceae bacterium 5K15]|uniref:NAD-dependent epimerase/dehydratase family protein n=1 Tax=Oceaniferula flava TaxID=2800421 RepID=A0AAE2SC81_9BACT|nr:NAD-dependent epimerase/dehydratase family protein [Oceaniferula flavus]MBK1854259.1 NAD-dependent epimerase/dehydratase family protein [Oceaniferula flavus]MBM1135565.1 NAD-dependent epimerase/dehydratase family protein [Oceaniferula flavus]